VKSPLRWLLEEGSHTERVEYHLGRAPPEVGLKRANRLEVLLRSARRRLPSPDKWPYQLGLRAVPNTLPQVLCIGAQKAGTTWLYENLARHPEVFVPPEVKEVHYFDFLFHHPLADYAEVFAAGRGQVRCDITPNYGRLRAERIRFCHRVMPDARLIFLMRNPVERAWSQAVMDLAKRSNRRFEDVPAEDFQKHFRSPSIRGNGGYCDMIDRWLAVYRPRPASTPDPHLSPHRRLRGRALGGLPAHRAHPRRPRRAATRCLPGQPGGDLRSGDRAPGPALRRL